MIDEVKVSSLLKEFLKRLKKNHYTLNELIDALQERSFGLALLLLSLPNALLLASFPGVSTLFGIPLIFISLQMILQRPTIWLPKYLGSRSLSHKSLESILNKSYPYLTSIERFIKLRWGFFTSKPSIRFVGGMCLVLSIIIALPIPFGNFLPGLVLVIFALGIIAKDGVYILIGSILSLVIFILLILIPTLFIQNVQGFFH